MCRSNPASSDVRLSSACPLLDVGMMVIFLPHGSRRIARVASWPFNFGNPRTLTARTGQWTFTVQKKELPAKIGDRLTALIRKAVPEVDTVKTPRK